jgi:dTDP-4-amino-4,6-dideoxygalactose transaminase
LNLGFKRGDFPEAEKHFSTAISLPLYVDLKQREQKKVIKSVQEFFD